MAVILTLADLTHKEPVVGCLVDLLAEQVPKDRQGKENAREIEAEIEL